MFDPGYHCAHKGAATLCGYIFMVAHPITSDLLSVGWFMGYLKRIYLFHEVSDDQFCGQAVTGINPFTSEFSVSCCYFEFYADMNEKLHNYLKDFIAYVHVLSTDVFIIVDILLASVFCH